MTRGLQALAILTLFVAVGVAGYARTNAREVERVSRILHSTRTSEAKQKGTLVKQPVLPESTFVSDGKTYRVTDLFVEQATHVEYRMLFFKRVVRDSSWRLVFAFTPRIPGGGLPPMFMPGGGIPSGPTGVMSSSLTDSDPQRQVISTFVEPPFPDTLRFRLDSAPPPARKPRFPG
jgi:hypothetical protein